MAKSVKAKKSTKSAKTKKKSVKTKKKNSLSPLEMIREKYGEDYGVKHDIQIEKYLRENGYGAIADFLENGKKKNKNTGT